MRLPNGNTLITTGNGHSVMEVTPKKEIVWKLDQSDLPGVTLAWVTTLEVLPDGNYVIGNCHAGAGQPLLVEIDPKTKKVVWKFDQFDTYGNSVSNSQILDAAGRFADRNGSSGQAADASWRSLSAMARRASRTT